MSLTNKVQEGKVLGSGYIKPTVPISEGAFEKHGIREEQLDDAPTFDEAWPVIRELLADRTVVIYNAGFDIGKLWSTARVYSIDISYDFVQSVCAMELFAQFYGEIHEYWGKYTWQKLNEVAIPYLKIQVPGQAHNAEHDAAATAMIIKKLAELADQELAPSWHPPVDVPCTGCGQVVQECKELDEVWYCRWCSLERGLFHRCPGCNRMVETPARGFSCEDLCIYCHQKLYQEMMLLTGAWHYCPCSRYHVQYRIVETSNQDEPCGFCIQQLEWDRQQEEAERKRQESIEQERKEHRRAYAKDYRKKKKERDEENRRRAELGLPPLEQKKARPAEDIINHRGHQFRWQKDQYGRNEVYCLRCEAIWSTPPRCYCAGIKTYRSWTAIPEHLKTQTQLLKLKLKPDKEQKHEAIMQGSFDSYCLYNKNKCVPILPKRSSKAAQAENNEVVMGVIEQR